jgi:hypothetical protein
MAEELDKGPYRNVAVRIDCERENVSRVRTAAAHWVKRTRPDIVSRAVMVDEGAEVIFERRHP